MPIIRDATPYGVAAVLKDHRKCNATPYDRFGTSQILAWLHNTMNEDTYFVIACSFSLTKPLRKLTLTTT